MHVEALTKSSLIQQGAISQHEHPLLGHPFYYIHPCDTTALMTQLHITDANSYIASWISFFGPPVGMGIGSEYFI
jgi:ubiquitin-like-conjugating enzyme ATG10